MYTVSFCSLPSRTSRFRRYRMSWYGLWQRPDDDIAAPLERRGHRLGKLAGRVLGFLCSRSPYVDSITT